MKINKILLKQKYELIFKIGLSVLGAFLFPNIIYSIVILGKNTKISDGIYNQENL